MVRFEKGAVGSLHHIHRQVSYVKSGKFEVTIDGNKNILQKDDCFFAASDQIHGVVALEQRWLVDVFTRQEKALSKIIYCFNLLVQRNCCLVILSIKLLHITQKSILLTKEPAMKPALLHISQQKR